MIMQYIADLHIHSKYSRATSRDADLEHIELWCKKKGINIVATGDWTHPVWFSELQKKLEPLGNGLYQLKGSDGQIKFFCSTEVSCIYSKGGKVRRLHIVVFAPSLKVVEKINAQLSLIGNLKADGRPILGLDTKKLLEIVLAVDEKCLIIPAHAWTPWFAVFGSQSGFDNLEECFEEQTKHVHAIETGLSSSPLMNWRLSALDNITLISCSDAHSPANLGREACAFEFSENELSYEAICQAIKNKDQNKFKFTLEFYPEEGMYHYDGHRSCNVSLSPEETKKIKNICPQCGKKLTIGVLHRVDNLADRQAGFIPKNAIPFKSLVGLDDVIAESLGVAGRKTKAVQNEYENLIKKCGSEFNVLLNYSLDDLKKITKERIIEAIRRNRTGELSVKPGYDGVYGEVKIFSSEERQNQPQKSLF
jgi:uncharacterized protein (TIGR00375 family)